MSFKIIACLIVTTSLWAGCSQVGSKCIFIAQKDGKLEFKAIMMGGAPKITAPIPGRVVAFRESQRFGATIVSYGEAGKVYRIDGQYQLKQIGEFEPSATDDQLLAKYAEPCE